MLTVRPDRLKIRCYAERQGSDIWVALCLDFDLAAQSETFHDARRKLDAMIVDYVESALVGEDREYADQLLNRRAPLRYWAKFYWFVLAHHFSRNFRAGTHRPFNEYLPISVSH